MIDGFEQDAYEQKVAPEILPRVGHLGAADIAPLPGTAANKRDVDNTDKPVRRRGRGVTGAAVFALTPEPEPIASADTDFDGKVTLDEFMAAARRRFAALDVDHDGRLRRAELPRTPAEKLAAKTAHGRATSRQDAPRPGGP